MFLSVRRRLLLYVLNVFLALIRAKLLFRLHLLVIQPGASIASGLSVFFLSCCLRFLFLLFFFFSSPSAFAPARLSWLLTVPLFGLVALKDRADYLG